MKRFILGFMVALSSVFSLNAISHSSIGFVNMEEIFKNSPEAKRINVSLKSQFSIRKEKIIQMGKDLKSDIKNYEKNRPVMDKKSLSNLKNSINKKITRLHQMQQKFEQDLTNTQNQKMADFVKSLKIAAQKVALKKDLDVLLPGNAVLYNNSKLDVTSSILDAMK